jgi:hypothetical protein
MNNEKLKIRITVSHNEVTENYSVMTTPSVLVVELNNERSITGKQFPYLLKIWGQQIWEMKYPNTLGKVIEVTIIN